MLICILTKNVITSCSVTMMLFLHLEVKPLMTLTTVLYLSCAKMRLRLGKVTVADVLAAQPVTTNLLKFMRASIKMIGVSNLQSFIASMTQKLTLSDISDESKNYLD